MTCRQITEYWYTVVEHTDVDGTAGHWSFELGDKLVGVESNLNDVVQQCKQRCQRKCRDEYRNKSILDHCKTAQ